MVKAMIPFIVNEPSFIVQEDMAKTLASQTGYSVKTIQSEVARLQDSQHEKRMNERRVILEKSMRLAYENPLEAEIILTSAKDQLLEVSKKYDEDRMSEHAFLAELLEQKRVQECKSDQFSGFILSSELRNFQDALQGEWDKDVLMVVGGKANTGKTAFLSKLAYDIASHEKENNAIVLYHTIDDTAEQLVPRLISIAEGTKSLTLNQIKDPNYWGKMNPNITYKRNLGYALVENLVKNGRLIVKDANHGTTISYMETLISYYQTRYPGRRLVYVLDNFHKLSDFSEHSDNERVRFKMLSKTIKRLATSYHIPILATMEYTKLAAGQKPTNNNIAESVAMEYDSNLIAHMYNDLHERGPNAEMFHLGIQDEHQVRMPRIEMIFGKNKISSFKSSLYFDFYPSSSDFISIDESVIVSEKQAADEAKAENNRRQGKIQSGGLYNNNRGINRND
jgi:replicative DNA helicase